MNISKYCTVQELGNVRKKNSIKIGKSSRISSEQNMSILLVSITDEKNMFDVFKQKIIKVFTIVLKQRKQSPSVMNDKRTIKKLKLPLK